VRQSEEREDDVSCVVVKVPWFGQLSMAWFSLELVGSFNLIYLVG
jgi:hypothetical protein